MGKLKIFIITIFVLSTASYAVGYDADFEIMYIEHGGTEADQSGNSYFFPYNDQTIEIATDCDGVDCPYTPRDSGLMEVAYLDICGDLLEPTDALHDRLYWEDVQLPAGEDGQNMRCSPGGGFGPIYVRQREDPDSDIMDIIDVEFHSHYAVQQRQLVVSINTEDEYLLRHELVPTFDGNDNTGIVHAHWKESDGWIFSGDEENLQMTATEGKILSDVNSGTGYSDNLADYTETDTEDYGNPGEVAEKSLGLGYSSQCFGHCVLGHLNTGSNSQYNLRGEIIWGIEFDETDDDWPEGSSLNHQQGRMHTCDTDAEDGHPDAEVMEGKHIFSPGDYFDTDYFYCDNDQWIPVNDCPTGYEYRLRAGEYECDKIEVDMDVQFFELEDVPGIDHGYRAGFRIEGEELDKFEEVYEEPVRHVGSQCWMGAKDERPSDSDLRGESERPAYQYDDVEITTYIPERDIETFEHVDKYSCIFSLENDNIEVHLGSNNPCDDCEEPHVNVNVEHISKNYDDLWSVTSTTDPFPGSYWGYDINDDYYNHNPINDWYNQYF